MKNEKLKKIKEKVRPVLINITKAIIIGVLVVASFYQGRFIERYKNGKEIELNVTKVNKDEVNIAIDESSNLIIIDNETGKYIIYQNSIGESIFKLYARNIWNRGTEESE
jgi:5,10-methylenetetrahydrofolate reductase